MRCVAVEGAGVNSYNEMYKYFIVLNILGVT